MGKLSVLLFLVILNKISGSPQFIAPYPLNIYAIEYQTAKATCVVTETDKDKKPSEIVFVRKTFFGEMILIPNEGPSGRTYYENKTKDDGRTLMVTLHFNNITANDDSAKAGRYQCNGYTGAKYTSIGFSVSVIPRNELPSVEVPQSKTVKFGDNVVLSCNVTLFHTTELQKLMWIKDGKVVEEVSNPEKLSMSFKVTSPTVGGIYSCHWITRLRHIMEYNTTGNIGVTVEPKFFAENLTNNVIEVLEGDDLTMNCSAKGNPLKTEWKKKLDADEEVKLIDESANTTEYEFSNLDKLEDHSLTIFKADSSDRGNYYCCIKSSNAKDENDVEGCQAFTLKVKGNKLNNIESTAVIYGFQSYLLLLAGLVAWLIPH